jgi:hypothetical protein
VCSRILARVVAVTAMGVALAACSNSSDPVGSVAAGPATGDAAKIQAADGNRFTPPTLELPAGEAKRRTRRPRRPPPAATTSPDVTRWPPASILGTSVI